MSKAKKKTPVVITNTAFKKVAGHKYSDDCTCNDCAQLWQAVLFGDAVFEPRQ